MSLIIIVTIVTILIIIIDITIPIHILYAKKISNFLYKVQLFLDYLVLYQRHLGVKIVDRYIDF